MAKPLVVFGTKRVEEVETLKVLFERKTWALEVVDSIKSLKDIVSEKNEVDAVVVDDTLGVEAIGEVKNTKPKLPVIFIDGEKGSKNAAAAMGKGAFDYVVKPFPMDLLIGMLERAIVLYRREKRSQAKRKYEQPFQERIIVTRDKKMLEILKIAEKIAPTDSSVLIQGESGTGKELIARFIHSRSNRKNKPFVAINCAALPENLLESELFGYEKGAFTGAVTSKPGKFEIADGGTLFLDEITEMPLSLQAKLLRALQEKEIDRVGGLKPIKVDVRIIASTNRDIKKLVEEGKFREDLYYRLNVIPIKLPPLRERKGDIMLLARYFVDKFSKELGKNPPDISPEVEEFFMRNPWKGNVRELENMVKRAVILCDGDTIKMEHLMLEEEDRREEMRGWEREVVLKPGMTLDEAERLLIEATLEEVGWNRTKAAELLGISIRTLRNKLKEYQLNQ